MSALTEVSQSAQRYICMLLSVAIVIASLSLGAFGARNAANDGYSVTITQLQ